MATLEFDLDAQWVFARFSGDYNPMHIDAKFARRTIAGQPVVHGVNILLSAAEQCLVSGLLPHGRPTSIKASFRRPFLLGERARLEIVTEQSRHRIKVMVNEKLVSTFDIELQNASPIEGGLAGISCETTAPLARVFEQLREGEGGRYRIACSEHYPFPRLVEMWGTPPVALLASLSAMVGMEVPGLESMLSELLLTFDGQHLDTSFDYMLTRIDERFRRLEIAVVGSGFQGKIVAFSPRSRVRQPTAAQVATVVRGNFQGHHALVIGGNRGLGEVVAKAVAAGGGRVTLTYVSGGDEAEQVASEINAFAGRRLATAVRLDATQPLENSPLADQRAFADISTIYYMATPQIFVERRQAFDPLLYARFTQVYVNFAAQLIAHFAADGANRVFMWPSTVAVDTSLASAAEYVVAKAAGEKLVEIAAKIWPTLRFVMQRLPRIATDQTIALSPTDEADVLDVIPDLVERTEGMFSAGAFAAQPN